MAINNHLLYISGFGIESSTINKCIEASSQLQVDYLVLY